MAVLRWTDELHQAWKNKRAAQLARELDRQSNTREDGAQYGQRVAAGGLPENPREVPKGSDRPPQSSGASSTYAASAKAPAGGESPSSVGHVQGAKADGVHVEAVNAGIKTAPATAASSPPIQRASPEAAHSQWAPRRATSAVRAPLYEIVHLCRAHRLPEPIPEYQFHPTRKWRFDYAWPLHKLALEVEGGIWTQGRHTRGAGALADMEKYSEAAIHGWRLLYVTPDQARGPAVELIRRALQSGIAS